MLIDSRKLPIDQVINTEVCIVGTGPAGITLARELIGQDFQVCLLESGDLEFNQETASLGEGETVGDPFPPLQDMRHRQFGGLANVWNIEINKNQLGLRHVPLDEIDFEKRDWVPYSGWPFSKSHLNPYYERAQAVCKLGSLMKLRLGKMLNLLGHISQATELLPVCFSSGHGIFSPINIARK